MMSQNYDAWVEKKTKSYSNCKIAQWIFNVTEYEEFIDAILDSTLLLTFKKLSYVGFWHDIK